MKSQRCKKAKSNFRLLESLVCPRGVCDLDLFTLYGLWISFLTVADPAEVYPPEAEP